MILKFAIIAGLVVLGGMIFYTEIGTLFPNTSVTAPEALKSDVEKLSDDATDFVADRLDETSVRLGEAAGNATESIIGNIQDVQERLTNGTSALNPLDSVQEIFVNDDNDADDEKDSK